MSETTKPEAWKRKVPRTLAECTTIEAATALACALTDAGFVPTMDMIDLLVSKTKKKKRSSGEA
jgi:hypothetical protein